MQTVLKIYLATLLSMLFVGCGSSTKEANGDLNDKKSQLAKLKTDEEKLVTQIHKLEQEIAKIDPDAAAKPKLVAVTTIGADSFSHFIDLQGKIDAQDVAMVSPRGQGAVVRTIYVKQGQSVRKGQLIMKLDNAIALHQLEAAKNQIAGLEAQAKLAESIYQRQQNLWKDNIGSEVQVLQAKTNAENVSAQLKAAKSQVSLAQESADLGNVYAEINGAIDVVNVKVGEFFSPQTASMPMSGIRIVNTGDLKVLVQVPENYSNRIQVGSRLKITLPEMNNKVVFSTISVVGKLIDPIGRTFFIEGKMPQEKNVKTNQIAKVQILDYVSATAITIPINTLQTDEKGKYVLVGVSENGKMYARKKAVIIGDLYGDKLEIKSGLAAGDKIITEGFQNLYEGQLITI